MTMLLPTILLLLLLSGCSGTLDTASDLKPSSTDTPPSADSAATPEASSPAAIAAVYHFLEISDFHNAIESSEGEPVFSVLAANLKRRDAENPGRTLILSGGDNVDGSEKVFREAKDAPVMEALNEIGVDATAFGNNEYETYGVDVLKSETLLNCGFPVLCANVLDKRTGLPVFEPYRIFQLEGLRVAVVGSSCYKIRDRSLKKKNSPYTYVEHAEAVNAQVARIRSEALADVVLALIHEGGYVDKNGNGGGAVFDVAEQLVGVDAVFGGDTHTVAQGLVNGMPVVIPGAYGQGYMDVTLSVDAAGMKSFETAYVNLDTHEPEGYAGPDPVRDEAVERILAAAGYEFEQ